MYVIDEGRRYLRNVYQPDFPPGRAINAPNFVMVVTFPVTMLPTANSINVCIFSFYEKYALMIDIIEYPLAVLGQAQLIPWPGP